VRRQIWLLVAATTSLVMLAFVVPLMVLVERTADREAVADARVRTHAVVPVVAAGDADAAGVAALAATGGPYSVVVRLPDGRTVGAPPDQWRGGTADTGIRTTTVRRLGDGSAVVDQPVFRGDGTAVISARVSAAALNQGVVRSWAVLATLGLALVALSLLVADRLARSMTRPVSELAATADRLGGGNLDTEVVPGGPREIREVGAAMNIMAQRIRMLVASERQAVADLSHRLRTPVTALRLDAEGLRDPVERARLTADVDELVLQVDAIIEHARRPVSDPTGAPPVTDLVAVVADRMDFWQVLAEEQSRLATTKLPALPCLVAAREDDVAAALDALLDNVFAHTPEGTPFTVTVSADDPDGATLTVRDEGPGFADGGVLERGESRAGSSGLGLDIAARLARGTGGSAEIEADGPGAVVRLRLGGPGLPAAGAAPPLQESCATPVVPPPAAAPEPAGLSQTEETHEAPGARDLPRVRLP
jgi:signal transduction histidine kinase